MATRPQRDVGNSPFGKHGLLVSSGGVRPRAARHVGWQRRWREPMATLPQDVETSALVFTSKHGLLVSSGGVNAYQMLSDGWSIRQADIRRDISGDRQNNRPSTANGAWVDDSGRLSGPQGKASFDSLRTHYTTRSSDLADTVVHAGLSGTVVYAGPSGTVVYAGPSGPVVYAGPSSPAPGKAGGN